MSSKGLSHLINIGVRTGNIENINIEVDDMVFEFGECGGKEDE